MSFREPGPRPTDRDIEAAMKQAMRKTADRTERELGRAFADGADGVDMIMVMSHENSPKLHKRAVAHDDYHLIDPGELMSIYSRRWTADENGEEPATPNLFGLTAERYDFRGWSFADLNPKNPPPPRRS